jgi:membrane protein YdbS with pleckstrin-like domain
MPAIVPAGVVGISGAAAAAPVPAAEQTLWEGSPSIALLYGKLLRLIVRFLVLVLIGYFAIVKGLPILASSQSSLGTFVVEHGNRVELGIMAVLTLAFIPAVVALLVAGARNRSTRYRVTNQRIVIESGLFSRSLDEIDLRSVDDIELRQSFVERLFNIGEIALVSTDKVGPRRTLHGIHDPRNSREVIRAAVYHVSQRQLFTRST